VAQKWVTFLLSHPIPKPFTKYGKEDVFKVVPYIEVVNHLGIRFCQELWTTLIIGYFSIDYQ
jgi:hypothetical protein